MAIEGKHERGAAIKAARNALIAELTEGMDADEVGAPIQRLRKSLGQVADQNHADQSGRARIRVDGRATDEIRAIDCQVGVAARTHGSALFTRGETQAFVSATLGIELDAQRIDFAGATDNIRRWMLQYNFPPFCTGKGGPSHDGSEAT